MNRSEPDTRVVENSIRSPSGEALYSELHTPRGNLLGTVVLVHGMAEHLGRYAHIIRELNEKGYQVLAYDQRGHGRSTGQRVHVGNFRDYWVDLEAVMERAFAFQLPTFILAHSMGSLVALLYLAKRTSKSPVAAATFIGLPNKPVVEVPAVKHWGALVCAQVLPRLGFKHEVNPHDLSRNEEVGKRYMADPLVNQVATAGWYRAFLEAVEELPQSLAGVTVPALFLHGGDDHIAHPDGSRVVFQAYPAAEKQLHIYEGCYHELLNEDCYPGILDEIHHWFQSVVAGHGSAKLSSLGNS